MERWMKLKVISYEDDNIKIENDKIIVKRHPYGDGYGNNLKDSLKIYRSLQSTIDEIMKDINEDNGPKVIWYQQMA